MITVEEIVRRTNCFDGRVITYFSELFKSGCNKGCYMTGKRVATLHKNKA